MKFRIDLQRAVKDPLHGIWIACYIGAAMIALGAVQESFVHVAGWGDPAIPIAHAVLPAQPAVLAGGIEVAEGILQFSGHTARGVWSGYVTTTLMAMLISYMVGPALLVWGIRARARHRQQIAVRGGVPAIAAALALGGSTLAAVVPAPLYALVSHRTYTMLERDHRHSEALDDLSVELYVMARNAQVEYHRSGEPRGGGHTWLTPVHGRKGPLRMCDLLGPGRGPQCTESAHVTIGRQMFSLRIERADSLTLHGLVVCEPPGCPAPADTSGQDTLSMVVGVTPLNVNMIFEE